MSLTLKNDNTGGDFKLLPPGNHLALCIGIVDFGPQETEYNGEKKEQGKIRLQFEVPAERVTWTDKDGVEHEGPMTVGKTYTASMYEKAKLREHLEGWRGRQFTREEEMGFNITAVLGKPCTLTVMHKTHQATGKQWADITMISMAPKGTNLTPEGDLLSFDFDNHTDDELNALPEWMRNKVNDGKALLERQKARVANTSPPAPPPPPPPADEIADDDIPF